MLIYAIMPYFIKLNLINSIVFIPRFKKAALHLLYFLLLCFSSFGINIIESNLVSHRMNINNVGQIDSTTSFFIPSITRFPWWYRVKKNYYQSNISKCGIYKVHSFIWMCFSIHRLICVVPSYCYFTHFTNYKMSFV